MKCPLCNAEIEDHLVFCPSCGAKLIEQESDEQQSNEQQTCKPQYNNQPQYNGQPQYYGNGYVEEWPAKSKLTAGILAILLGNIGVHKFYMGKVGMGILYLCFCWTCIPGVIGLIEGIIYLTSSREEFEYKNHVRCTDS